MKVLRMELKVCEGCGVLWLRPDQQDTVYCQRCAAKLAAFPPARGRRLSRGTRQRSPRERQGLRVVGGRGTAEATRMEGTR